MGKPLQLSGQTFGRITVLSPAPSRGYTSMWQCRCICGTIFTTQGSAVKNGHILSCGCLREEKKRKATTKHGQARKTPEWTAWQNMRMRCMQNLTPSFHRYGGRGIKVHASWHDFAVFFKDMGRRPSKYHSLDRINNEGDYEPGNVRWATRKEQADNRITTKIPSKLHDSIRKQRINGATVSTLSKKYNVSKSTISAILKH